MQDTASSVGNSSELMGPQIFQHLKHNQLINLNLIYFIIMSKYLYLCSL